MTHRRGRGHRWTPHGSVAPHMTRIDLGRRMSVAAVGRPKAVVYSAYSWHHAKSTPHTPGTTTRPSMYSRLKKNKFKDDWKRGRKHGRKDGQKDDRKDGQKDGQKKVETFGVEATWQEYKALFKQRQSNNDTTRIEGFATEQEMLLKMETLMNLENLESELKESLGEPSGFRCDEPACREWWEHYPVDGVCPHVICMGSCWAEWACAPLLENEM